jgi:hypothetical protein
MRIATISRVSLSIVVTLCGVAIAALLLHRAGSEGERELARQQELSEAFVDALRDLAFDHSHAVSRAALGPGLVDDIKADLADLDEATGRVEAQFDALEASGAGVALLSPLERSLDAWKQLRTYERSALQPFPGGGPRAVLLSRRHEALRGGFVESLSGATEAIRTQFKAQIETREQAGDRKDRVALAAMVFCFVGGLALLQVFARRHLTRTFAALGRGARRRTIIPRVPARAGH